MFDSSFVKAGELKVVSTPPKSGSSCLALQLASELAQSRHVLLVDTHNMACTVNRRMSLLATPPSLELVLRRGEKFNIDSLSHVSADVIIVDHVDFIDDWRKRLSRVVKSTGAAVVAFRMLPKSGVASGVTIRRDEGRFWLNTGDRRCEIKFEFPRWSAV